MAQQVLDTPMLPAITNDNDEIEWDDIDLGATMQEVASDTESQFNISDFESMKILSSTKPSNVKKIKIKTSEVKRWISKKCKKPGNKGDKFSVAGQMLTFGGFLYLINLLGDTFIDKLTGYVNRAASMIKSIFHGLGHGICVGVGFFISFILEWIFLSIQYCRGEFDPNDATNNRKVYWYHVRRSLKANLVAAGITIAVAALLGLVCALTAGIGCVVIIGIVVVVGCIAKWGVKWFIDRDLRAYYNALRKLKFLKVHKTFTTQELGEQYIAMKKMVERGEVNDDKLRKKLAEYDAAYQWLILYCKIRNKENGYLASKVDYYIRQKEKSCLIM